VYEKRLIETYITENGTEPTTGEALTVEDLIDLKTQKTVRPRPPTLTSIPSLLGVFQEEWDALALETYTLRKNLAQTRQDLSNALYQHDAAVRVIARVTKERDEAREALASLNLRPGAAAAPDTNGDAMHVDPKPLPENIIAKIDSTKERYAALRFSVIC
jgi:pre-mRNA-processing factor 19